MAVIHESWDAALDRRALLAEVHALTERLARETQLRQAFEGAAADLALAGISERDALRKVVEILTVDLRPEASA